MTKKQKKYFKAQRAAINEGVKYLVQEQKKKPKADIQFNKLSNKQMIVLTWWCSFSPYKNKSGIICDGAVRSGKTWAMSLSFVLWAMDTFNNEDFIMCGKTIAALQRNVVKPLVKILLNRGFQITTRLSENFMIVKSKKNTNTFYFFGGKDEGSQDLVQGLTAAGAYFDEVALMPESFVNQASARCSVENSKLWFNCNPEHPEHYFKLEWIDKISSKELIHLHFTMDDNPSLSESKKAYYNKLYSGVFHDRMIKGLWRRASGLIYRKYADNPQAFIIDEIKERLVHINIGVDFGGSKSSTVFIATGFTNNYKTVYILDEKVINEEITPDDLNDAFCKFCKNIIDKYNKVLIARCDSAEPVLIRGLQASTIKNRINVVIKNAYKRSINDRIKAEQVLFSCGSIKILSHCKEIQSAFLSSVWDEKHPDERLDEVGHYNPVDRLDAFEYSFEEFINLLVDLKIA